MEERNIIRNAVESTLDGLKYHYLKLGRVFRFKLKEENVIYRYVIVADDEHEYLVVVGAFPVHVPKPSFDMMCTYINELNRMDIPGRFVINPDDGELTFRIISSVHGCTFNENHILYCLDMVSLALSRQYEGIMKALYGGSQMVFTFGGKEKPEEQ